MNRTERTLRVPAEGRPGSSSSTVLCSRCVPNCFATVEYVDPVADRAVDLLS